MPVTVVKTPLMFTLILLQFRQWTVPLTSCSLWTSLEVSLELISAWWSRFYHSWSADWISTAVTPASVLSLSRQMLEPGSIWMHTRQPDHCSQPSHHSHRRVAAPTRLVRLPTSVLWCWLQRQVTAATYLTLSSSLLMEIRLTLQLRRSV